MVNLRIRDLAAAKGLTVSELSEVSGISSETMMKYATESVEITEETAANLRKMAEKLDVPVIELIKPINKPPAFKLRIIEKAQEKGISLEQLSEKSGVHPAVLAFYATQPISEEKLADSNSQTSLGKINQILQCATEELQVVANIPTTKLGVEKLLEERMLSLEELSLLSNLPLEFVDLMATQPVDISTFESISGIELTESSDLPVLPQNSLP
jgi:transcriptional regulator with XRE-family HTH domain